MPGLGEYLVQTGLVWPLAGTVLVIAILWRRGFFQSEPPVHYETRGIDITTRSLPPQSDMDSAPALTPVPATPNGRPVGGQQMIALTPQEGFHYPQYHPQMMHQQMMHQQMMPQQMIPYGQAQNQSGLSPTDFKALLDRSRHDELLADGVASLKAVFNNQAPDLATRMGVMTARKVIEIERMLVEELEESLISKVGFVASLFHSWRCEVSTLRTGRRFEEDFHRQKTDWEKYLTENAQSCEDKLLTAAQQLEAQKQRFHQTVVTMTDMWFNGDDVGLCHAVFKAWMNWASRAHAEGVQKNNVKSVVACWTEGNQRGTMHMCFMSWYWQAATEVETRRQEHAFNAAKRNWDSFLDDESAKHQAELDSAMQSMESRRDRAHASVTAIVSNWERGERHGIMSTVLYAWSQHNRKCRMFKRQQKAVQQSMMQFCEGNDRGSMHGMFISWKLLTQHEVAWKHEHQKWEDMLNGERSRREQDEAERQDTEARRLDAAHKAVELAMRRWQLGNSQGTLTEIVECWGLYARTRNASNRRREAVHGTLLRWSEGEKKGVLHACFMHWKADTSHMKLRRQHEQELKRQQATWDEMLTDTRRRHEEEMTDKRTDAEKRHDQAHAVVDYCILRWELGDNTGLMRELVGAWAIWTREAERIARKAQAVHVALEKFVEGEVRGVLHSCYLNWRTETRRVLQQSFGEQHLADEKTKWDAFLENERRLHAEALDEAMTEAEKRRARAHEATQLMLRQWGKGDVTGLSLAILSEWRRVKDEVNNLNWRKQAVHLAMSRFVEGDRRGAAHVCLLNWKQWAKAEIVFKTDIWEKNRKITQLEERTMKLLSKEQTRLLKYATKLGSADDPVMLIMIVAQWHMMCMGIKAVEAQRQLEIELEDRNRQHEVAVARRRHMAATTLELMGCKTDHMIVLDHFMSWTWEWRQKKQEWAHRLAQDKMVQKYAFFLECQFVKQDAGSMLAACFNEFLREAKRARQMRHEERIEVSENLIKEFYAERASLEQRLSLSDTQIQRITETLKKEMQNKKELADELEQAYAIMRKTENAPRADLPVLGSSRPTPTNRDRGGHIPRDFGTPGSVRSLNKPLIKPEED